METTKKYFLSFIEEGIMNPKYYGYVGGRIEVYDNEGTIRSDGYAIEEVRFFTKKKDKFYDFREAWDFKDVDEAELKTIKKITKKEYHEKV